jgi:hypothetical protein
MFLFTEGERASLTEMRAITTDSKGQELLVGLNEEETAFCMEHRRKFLSGTRDRDNRARYLELNHRHELSRLAVLGTEIYVRNENPPRH